MVTIPLDSLSLSLSRSLSLIIHRYTITDYKVAIRYPQKTLFWISRPLYCRCGVQGFELVGGRASGLLRGLWVVLPQVSLGFRV